MNHDQFAILLNDRCDSMRATLSKKGREYSSADDKLHNFKRAAAVLGTTPEKALLGMLAKHLVSLLDMVDKGGRPAIHMVDEKVGDAINYLVLLEALWKEEGI